jgi:hypothetical protein
MRKKLRWISSGVTTTTNDMTKRQVGVERVNAYMDQKSAQINRQATRSETSGNAGGSPFLRLHGRPTQSSRLRLYTSLLFLLTLLLMLTGVAWIGLHRSAHANSAVSVNVPLSVPYLQQYQRQSTQNYDCGPASVAMVLEYYHAQPSNSSNANLMTQVRNSTGNPTASDTTFPQLERALSHYGLSYNEISSRLSPQPSAQMRAMQQATASGKPVIALISGTDLGRGSRYGGHWVVVTGFSSGGQTVYLNDPDNQPSRGRQGWIQGGQITLPLSIFQKAALDAPPGPYGITVFAAHPIHDPLPSDLRYVTNLYHDVLGRTASAGEINGWAQSIANGASRAQVANGFLASAEYRTNLVAADYQQTLHRAADPSGSAYFVGQLNKGVKNEDVLIALAASDEYFISRGGSTNSGFVSALYQDLLQRTAAPSEVASWTQQMSHGMSRATVVRGFVTAQEYRTKLVSAYYQHYLGRAADPGGLSNFVAVLNNRPLPQ